MKLIVWCLLIAILYLSRSEVYGLPIDEDNIDNEEDDLDSEEVEYGEDEEDLGPVPEFKVSGQTFTVHVGDGVRLPCEVDNLGNYVILWKREEGDVLAAGSMLISRDERISLDNGSIVISPINYNDSGKYICQLSSTPPKQIVHTLDIIRPTSVQPVPSNGWIEVHRGSPVTLQCQADGNPFPQVTWTRLDKKKFSDGKLSQVGESITFSSADRHHSGTYRCTATNGYGDPASADINLTITYKPIITVEKLFIGNSEDLYDVEISCDVHGEPKPKVWWLKNGLPFETADEHHSGPRYVMSIKSMQQEDFANYSCAAENKLGKQEEKVEITGLPGSVVLLQNNSISHGVELEWRTESLTPVMEYRLHYSSFGTPHEEVIIPARPTKKAINIYSHIHRLQNLHPGRTYEITIEAKNSFGWSQPSTFYISPSLEDLNQVNSHNSELKAGNSLQDSRSSAAAREQCWWILIATLVLCFKINSPLDVI